MIRALTVVLGLSLTGCAKNAPVEMSMKRNMADDVSSLVLKSVELQHEKEGWVSVSIGTAAATENGTEVSIGMTELPKGTYTSARVKYERTTQRMAATKTITRDEPEAPEGDAAAGDSAEAAPTKKIKREEPKPEPGTPVAETNEGMVTSAAEFCIKGGENDLMLVVKEKGSEVMLKVNGPEC